MEEEGPSPTRWEVELEFIQSLANPMYVHFLAQNNYLESPEFLNYLNHLEYWRRPEYVKFIAYPNCLHMLHLLQQPLFRQEICKAEVARIVMDDYYRRWSLDGKEPETQDAEGPSINTVTKNMSDVSL